MTFDAQVIEVLIASPGDIPEEREIIADLLYEWNFLNSRDRNAVLLPLRWETHAYPEMGDSPQAIINHQVVDHCDMAIGVFWTRLGTPTDAAESGTAEEIARVGDSGKSVMVYFSNAKVQPESLDLEEFQRLKDFKKKTYPRGLISSYDTIDEFREKFRRHLGMKINEVLSANLARESGIPDDRGQIQLAFAEGATSNIIGTDAVLRVPQIICVDQDQIPDFLYRPSYSQSSYITAGTIAITPNQAYLRETVDWYCELALRKSLHIALSNPSRRSVHDIHLDAEITVEEGNATIKPPELTRPMASPNIIMNSFATNLYSPPVSYAANVYPQIGENLAEGSDGVWQLKVDVPVAQQQRTVVLENSFSVRSDTNSKIRFEAEVFTSEFEPFHLNAQIKLVMRRVEMSYREILKLALPSEYNDIPELQE